MYALEHIINAFAPHRCLVCLAEGSLLCRTCEGHLPAAPSRCYKCGRNGQYRLCDSCRRHGSLDGLVVAASYAGAAKELVGSLKFKRAPAAAMPMARLLIQRFGAGPTLICFVPTATSRIRQRGYDQAALLAREVGRQTGLPCRRLLMRQGQQRQVGKNQATRRRQLLQAFRPVGRETIAAERILLIDDVLTTGATLESAAATLKAAGAVHISAAVFAWAA